MTSLSRLINDDLFDVQLLGVVYEFAAPHVFKTLPTVSWLNRAYSIFFYRDPATSHDAICAVLSGEIYSVDLVTGESKSIRFQHDDESKECAAAAFDDQHQQWVVVFTGRYHMFDICLYSWQGEWIKTIATVSWNLPRLPLRIHPVTNELMCCDSNIREKMRALRAVEIQSGKSREWKIGHRNFEWFHPHPTEPTVFTVNCIGYRDLNSILVLCKWNEQGEQLFQVPIDSRSYIVWSPYFHGMCEWYCDGQNQVKVWSLDGEPRWTDLCLPPSPDGSAFTKTEWYGRVYAYWISPDGNDSIKVLEYAGLPLKSN